MKFLSSSSLKILGSLVVLALLIYFLMKSGADFSWSQVTHSAQAVGVLPFLLALVLVCGQTGCQILRLWFLLPSDGKLSLGLVAYAYSVGQWLNSFVPARAGDVVKAVIVSRDASRGALAHNAGVVVADKLVDLISLFSLVLFVGGFAHVTQAFGGLKSPWVFGIALAIIALFVLLRKHLYRRFPTASKFVAGFQCLAKWKHSIPAWFVSQGSWAFEAVAMATLVRALGFQLFFDQAVFCLFILNLAIAVPVSMANVGTFEASLVFALGRFGLGASEALAIAVLHHIIQWTGISLWAGGTWLIRRCTSRVEMRKRFRVKDSDKERALKYYGKLAGDYDDAVNRGPLRNFRERERRQMLEFSDLNHPAQSMIDVGCGNGFYALRAKKNGLVVTAVDANPQMVDRLKGKVDDAFVADVENLSVQKTFDRVVCAGVLDFVTRPPEAFKNLARLVAPGGRLIVLSPRVGWGGSAYRIEKGILGIRINLYNLEWYRVQAAQFGLELRDYAFPLWTNMAVFFERPRQPS